MNVRRESVRLIRIALRRWKVIVVCSAIAGAASMALTLLSGREWNVPFAFVTESDKDSGGSSLATELGLGSASSTGPDFYVDLLKTNEPLLPLMVKWYHPNRNPRDSILLVDLLEIPRGPAELRTANALKMLHTRIIASSSRRSGIINVAVRLPDRFIAKDVAEDILAAINDVNSRVRQTKGHNDRVFTEARLGVVRGELRTAEDNLREFLKGNRFIQSPDLQVERMRMEREVNVRTTTLQSLLIAYESARRDEAKNTPQISIIDRPRVPAIGMPRNTLRRGLLTSFFAGAIVVFLAYRAESRGTHSIRRQFRMDLARMKAMLITDELPEERVHPREIQGVS